MHMTFTKAKCVGRYKNDFGFHQVNGREGGREGVGPTVYVREREEVFMRISESQNGALNKGEI